MKQAKTNICKTRFSRERDEENYQFGLLLLLTPSLFLLLLVLQFLLACTGSKQTYKQIVNLTPKTIGQQKKCSS